ncbi:Hint domain-containing protein [Thalassococcus sp. S3]|uniref:Hint domain-containing protein n=1 Tax=Thalassococcus sp. S3 TaxID=2017482 RepID=UPI0020C54A81|nr:Hint domain-containing protein [Thalassococcus sp. S3]
MPHRSIPTQTLPVYPAHQFQVTVGANMGDGLSYLEDLIADDVYMLTNDAHRQRLSLDTGDDETFRVSEQSETGYPGNVLHLDCTLTLMSPDGQTQDALVIVETDTTRNIAGIFLLPLAELSHKTEYTLVGMDRDTAREKFAQVGLVSFTRGTRITMSSGAQKPIEDLQIGDRVLTRDDGPQEILWKGQTTIRAVGEFAPILIERGALNNANDLLVSPDHRLFVYQRSDDIGAGQAELLIKARHLVNGDSVRVQEGGFVDYFQILFDRHHIIYAEGIAAESMFLDPRTKPALPPDLLAKITAEDLGVDRVDHGVDVAKALLDRPDAIEILRRASSR